MIPRASFAVEPTTECPGCGAKVSEVHLAPLPPLPGGVPRIGGPGVVYVDGPHPAGNLVVVAAPGGWRVRYRTDAEHTVNVDGSRRREHQCPNPADRCTVCGDYPTRRYPLPRCDLHAPGAAVRPLVSARVPGMPE